MSAPPTWKPAPAHIPAARSKARLLLWNLLALAIHLLMPAIFLMHVLRAPEAMLRKVVTLQMLLLMARSVYFLRAMKHMGAMIAMLGKVRCRRAGWLPYRILWGRHGCGMPGR